MDMYRREFRCALPARLMAGIEMSRIVTYSSSRTLVPTYECFNRCTYCTFRRDGPQMMMTTAEMSRQLDSAERLGVREILVLSGEVHPKSRRRHEWFTHIRKVCSLALERGFLPHTNAGPLSLGEMEQLRDVNVSMGLMLEQATPKLMQGVHKRAPSKSPALRIEQLRMAGRLRIPFTTGLLLGIGEDEKDWTSSLALIRDIQLQFGHIQECIMQPYSPGETVKRSVRNAPEQGFPLDKLPQAVALAREILPASVSIQVPPNLLFVGNETVLPACIEAGASDLGGIGPIDEVNPMYSFPTAASLRKVLSKYSIQLVERLALYSR